MAHPPRFKLSEILESCYENKDYPSTFMTQAIPNILPIIKNLEIAAKGHISQCFEYHKFKAKTIIQHPNTCTTHLWILIEGIAHTYVDLNDKISSTDFHFPGEFMGHFSHTALPQYHTNAVIETTGLQTLTPAKSWCIAYHDLTHLRIRFEQINQLIEQLIACKVDWLQQLSARKSTLSTQEHCQYIKEHFPQYFMHIPQERLATFLHINRHYLCSLLT